LKFEANEIMCHAATSDNDIYCSDYYIKGMFQWFLYMYVLLMLISTNGTWNFQTLDKVF